MLGLNGSELKETISLSESVRRGLGEIADAKEGDFVLRRAAAKFELNVGMSIPEVVKALRRLESAIEEGDVSGYSEASDMIDSVVDYLVVVIGMLDSTPNRGGGARLRLEHLRRDAGRLAQYICQLTEAAV